MPKQQTLERYLTEPYSVTDPGCLLDDVVPISKFRQMLTTLKGQVSFTNPAKTRPICTAPHGYITIPSIVDSNLCYQSDGHPEFFVNNLKKFLNEYGDWEVTDTYGDNSYNYNSPVEGYIAINRITIANPDSVAFESKDLLFMSIGLSLDPRGEYTESAIAVFDNDLDENYDSNNFMLLRFEIITGNFNYKSYTLGYSVEADMADEDYFINIYPDNPKQFDNQTIPNELRDQEEQSISFDATNKAALQKELEHIVHNYFQDSQSEPITNLIFNYHSSPVD